jgi:hypothetical protein
MTGEKRAADYESASRIQGALADWAYEYVMDRFDRGLSVRGEDFELVVDDNGVSQYPMRIMRFKDGVIFRVNVYVGVWPEVQTMRSAQDEG